MDATTILTSIAAGSGGVTAVGLVAWLLHGWIGKHYADREQRREHEDLSADQLLRLKLAREKVERERVRHAHPPTDPPGDPTDAPPGIAGHVLKALPGGRKAS